MVIAPAEHKTNVRFKIMDDFEIYVIAIVIDRDSEDVIFTAYVYKLKTSQLR